MDDNEAKKLLNELNLDFDKLKEDYKENEIAFWNFVRERDLSSPQLGQIGSTACVVAAIEANMSLEALLDIITKQYETEQKLAASTKEAIKKTLINLLDSLEPIKTNKESN